QGRLYVAYTDIYNIPTNPLDNTDIFLATSDDGGLTWSSSFQNPAAQVNDDVDSRTDGFSETLVDLSAQAVTRRPQFQRAVAVAPTTGTLAVSFYDARADAARSRVAMTVTTSIDGGRTFSPQSESFVNTPNAPFDEITRQDVTVGPIPDNISAGNPNV